MVFLLWHIMKCNNNHRKNSNEMISTYRQTTMKAPTEQQNSDVTAHMWRMSNDHDASCTSNSSSLSACENEPRSEASFDSESNRSRCESICPSTGGISESTS